jgi:phospholipid-binding lipoprotein MlaA
MNRRRVAPLLGLVAAALFVSACAGTPPNPADPWQGMNRPVFQFNDGVDHYVLRPVARGWTFITWDGLRDSVAKFYYNVAFPSRFVSNVGQAEGQQAIIEVARFLINTTVGIVGFFDPATRWGLPRRDEDVGQMFGRWGIPPGPYMAVPFLGPSDPRDLVGTVFDAALSPLTWFVPGSSVPNIINTRARADEKIEAARNSSLDYYVFVRDAYTQYRAAAVGNTAGTSDYDSSVYYESGRSDLYEVPEEKGESNAPKPKSKSK